MKNYLDSIDFKGSDLRFDKLNLNQKRLEEMHEYSKDPEFYKFMESSPSKSINETKKYLDTLINRTIKGSHGGDCMYWSIIDKTEDKMIGTIGFQSIKKSHSSACSTMGISTKYRTKARALEAVLSLLNFGFKSLKLHRVWAVTEKHNDAVIKMHKVFGFKEEGILRDYYFKGGVYVDAVMLSCLESDFKIKTVLKTILLIKKIKNE